MPSCHRAAITSNRVVCLLLCSSRAQSGVSIAVGHQFRTYEGVSISEVVTHTRHGISGRARRKSRQSPSRPLVDALKAAGIRVTLPYTEVHGRGHKVDLSYNNPKKPQWKSNPKLPGGPALTNLSKLLERTDKPRLQNILAAYIGQWASMKSARPDGIVDGDIELSGEELSFLSIRGYDIKDIKSWASIICATDVNLAAGEFHRHNRKWAQSISVPMPPFLLLFFARHGNMTPAALRVLLIYAWQTVRYKKSLKSVNASPVNQRGVTHKDHSQYPAIDDSTMFTLIVRLLRIARTTWPEAIVTITRMFIEVFGGLDQAQRSYTSTRRKSAAPRITALFNVMLQLLSIPSTVSPFNSVAYYQRAQFDLLNIMARHSPPLVITRSGYRAIISVQLANKKTDQERDWDNLKAKSWPPWKEEKTGLDAEKGSTYGTSRALEVLNRSKEAGYGTISRERNILIWDKVATIFAGWDTDGSPTIQTRALLLHKFVSHKDTSKSVRSKTNLVEWDFIDNDQAVWAARIRTTRTVHESWACFLAYNDRNTSPAKDVYLAMLEKLAYEHRRLRSQLRSTSSDVGKVRVLNAGDSRELTSPPLSPKEATFVRSEPPSLHALVSEMYHNGIMPTGPWIGFLLKHATTLSQGMQYLSWAKEKMSSIESLLVLRPELDNRLQEVPHPLFESFIGLLCKFPEGDRIPSEKLQQGQSYPSTSMGCRAINGYSPLAFACHLLKVRQPKYRPSWHKVIAALSSPAYIRRRSTQQFHRWTTIQSLVNDMSRIGLSLDNESLRLLCQSLECAVVTATHYPQPRDTFPSMRKSGIIEDEIAIDTTKSAFDLDIVNQANDILETSSQYIRTAFHEAMGTGKYLRMSSNSVANTGVSLPRLLMSPHAPTLHAYVRTLGLLRDWQGIQDTIRWMVKHEREIANGIDMPRNGARLLRRTIIAARVFLEGSWICYESPGVSTQENLAKQLMSTYAAPMRVVRIVRRLIDSVEAWGGWPLDTEVDEYCMAPNAQFPSVKQIF